MLTKNKNFSNFKFGSTFEIQNVSRQAARRAHQAAYERVHGVVARAAAENGTRQPEDAQLRDLEAVGRGVEAAHRDGKAAVY